jgi:hypothetical protein
MDMNKQLSVAYGNATIPFEVEYSSRRRTVQISVQAPGKVVVTAPSGRSDKELLDAVSRKARWITQKLYMMKSMRSQPVVREFVSGESLLYLGRNYRLALLLDPNVKKPVISLTKGVFSITTKTSDRDYLRPLMIDWYKHKADLKIRERIKYFAAKTGVTPKSVAIKEQKKRWGSCTSTGILYFNWRSILAPAHILDYIVAHELCHLIEKSHSSRFWAMLRAVMPDYEVRKQWLKENGVKLDV